MAWPYSYCKLACTWDRSQAWKIELARDRKHEFEFGLVKKHVRGVTRLDTRERGLRYVDLKWREREERGIWTDRG